VTDASHWGRLERMYRSAPVNQPLDVQIDIDKGRCEIRVPVRESMFHAAMAVHGSHYFKMLDDSAYFACNSLVEDVLLLTASFNVQLIKPVTAGSLRAVGNLIRHGKTVFFAESILYDDSGGEVARGNGVFARSMVRLDSVSSYAEANCPNPEKRG
jgi:uncharacterized protein (TIGR00369 family)